MDLQKNIAEFDLIFFDVETTGLDALTGDAICEISMLKFRKAKLIEEYNSLVNPMRPVSKEALAVHKIPKEELDIAPIFEAISKNVIDFIQNSILFAYNARFDVGFLNQEFLRINLKPIDQPVVDVFAVVRRSLNLFRYNLETAARHLGVEFENLHRAKDDAGVVCGVFYKMADILAGKKIATLGEYLSLYGLRNDFYNSYDNKKTSLLKSYTETRQKIKIKWFSNNNTFEEEVLSLEIFSEKEGDWLLCRRSSGENTRIAVSNILSINREF